eukprot:bmy_14817T0
MEAGLLSAILGIILVQVDMTAQDLDLQKVAFFLGPGRSSGSCETEQIVSSEVNVSGRFVFPGLSLPLACTGHREIQVIDTDYEQFAILRVSLHWRDKEFQVLKYFTRSLEGEYEPGFWKFRELTADTGLYLVARHGEPQTLGWVLG